VPETAPPSLEELHETFEYLEEWDERYQYIIELGRQLTPMPAGTHVEENRVHGCMSTVWLVTEFDPKAGKMLIIADSDSLIVKGLIVILTAAFSNKTPAEILRFDIEEVFADFGLNQHLSANRRNGLFSMVKRVKELAASVAS
jgi:cysteine desulfuration protein SufE